MVIQNSTGNVGVGTTSPNRRLEIDSSTAAPLLRLNNTVGGGNNGIEIIYSSSYKSWLIGAGYNIAGGLEFTPSTANGGTTFTTPAVAIDSSGNLLVGQTTVGSSNSNSLSLQGPNNQGSVGVNHASGSTSGTSYCYFGYNASTIGSITQNGTTGVLYNLTSDYRLKNNPVPVTGAKDFVMALQPKTWDWWDGSGKGVGFIAHEFMEVAKYSGHGEKDAVDEEGKIIPQSIQPSSSEVMANLVALMQEQQALITSQAAVLSSQAAVITQLQADVAALKGAK
jgi:hypothetical protein